MEQSDIKEFLERKKKQTVKLIEASELTKELAQAVNRGDKVSIQMILNMRHDPLRELQEMEQHIQDRLLELPQPDAVRMNELLKGAEPVSEQEKPLADQVGQYRRLLEAVAALDEQLSVRLGGKRSFYKKFRNP